MRPGAVDELRWMLIAVGGSVDGARATPKTACPTLESAPSLAAGTVGSYGIRAYNTASGQGTRRKYKSDAIHPDDGDYARADETVEAPAMRRTLL
jgi:hypothetical protein